jgi:hypothetical protein
MCYHGRLNMATESCGCGCGSLSLSLHTHHHPHDQFNEVYDYMKKKFVCPKDIDILKWWQDHSILYKELSRLATR